MPEPKNPEILPKPEISGYFDIRQTNPQPEMVRQRALVEAENNLRFSIGRYIHDNPQQRLQLALQVLREQAELLQSDGSQAQLQLAETNRQLLALLGQADSELSLLRREALPTDPRSGTLRMSIERYILEDFPRLHPEASFQIKYRLDDLVKLYDNPTQAEARPEATSEKMLISLFIREGLKNAYKHAQASRVALSGKKVFYHAKADFSGGLGALPTEGTYLRLTIKDNGGGFDLTGLEKMSQTGRPCSFFDFEARVRLLGGFSRLEAAVGKGTLWEIYLPLRPVRGKAHAA